MAEKILEIWAILLLPMTLKSCTKSNNSPNLVTLLLINFCNRAFFCFSSLYSDFQN